MDIFDTKGLSPMLISEMQDPFDSQDYIYEVKFDGIRCVAYLDEFGTDLRNKRNKCLLPHVPELAEIHRAVNKKCILDGELFVMKDGVTDFYEVQRRALLTDPFKISLASKKYPATFVAFDILYNENLIINDLPLLKRKELLSNIVTENSSIGISRYIEHSGIELFEQAKVQGLEGVVAKKKDSLYWFGKRSKEWVKFKVMSTEDCIICGYIRKKNSMTSLVLGQYDGNSLVYKGHVTLGVSLRSLNQHKYTVIDASPFGYVPSGNEDAVWLAPELVCIVESMPTEKESFRQPVFKGIRDDKTAIDCQLGG